MSILNSIIFGQYYGNRRAEQEKKRIGMAQAANNHKGSIFNFRTIAILLLDKFDSVTIDDVRKLADLRGIKYTTGNWMGSVFHDKYFEWTGLMVPATHYGSRGRMIKVWRKRSNG
jgi:hypothetical protein